ncbi:MAG: class I SAM-dependent methyltransferase [Pyrinomonadaceae bacterium]
MIKTERELAFLRDLVFNESWTKRFTDLLDKRAAPKNAKNLLYLNAGTGDHCIAIREKTFEKTAIFANCENDELLKIATAKGLAIKSEVDFSMIEFEEDSFDAVIADGSFTAPGQIEKLIRKAARAARSGGSVTTVLPSAGSFGEIFSLLWEVLFNEDLGEHGAAVEAMVAEIPTLSRIEEIAGDAGLVNIKTESATELFEYENGKDFVASPLIADFLMSRWVEYLTEKEKERVTEKLAQLIDSEDGSLSFRFSVKATLLIGEKSERVKECPDVLPFSPFHLSTLSLVLALFHFRASAHFFH